MKYSLITFVVCIFLNSHSNAQSLSLGSGFFLENYRPTGNRSQFHDKATSYYWAFLGGSASFNFSLKKNWFRTMSIYANAYPSMYGFDLSKYPDNNALLISQDLITPEIGILSYYQVVNKPKHKIDMGTGLSLRFAISPITGAQSSYSSFSLSFESSHIQKSAVVLLLPLDLRYTYHFKPQLGLFFSMKRTIGLFNWIEQRISYEYTNPNTGITDAGTATMVSNGGRSLIEFGLVFNLARIN